MRNFLLSDRWFSWDKPIEANIGLTTSTSLVEEIKRLMVDNSLGFQLPPPPTPPTWPKGVDAPISMQLLSKYLWMYLVLPPK
jgi:hypothetical protein